MFIYLRGLTPGYIDATRIPLIQGRYISDDDTANADRVVVLNQEAARRYLSDRNPIGATLDIDGERTVVGVVGNVRVRGPEQQPRPEAYMPASESTIYGGDFVIRAVADTQAIIPAVKEAIWQSLPDTPVRNVITLETLLGRLLAQRRFSMLLVGLLGVLAITIAAVGIYGVMAYTVTQRAPEISLRMALGAPRERVLGMILSKASMLLGVGLIIGIAGAWLLAGLVKSFLFDVDPRDATVFGVSAAVLFACGLLAALLPALRASRIDPIVALAGRR